VIAIPLFQILGKIPEPATGGTLVDSFGGLILPLVGWALPVFVLTGFMKRIPADVEEAAGSTERRTSGSSRGSCCRCAGRARHLRRLRVPD